MEYLTSKQAAEYLKVKIATITGWYRKGKIKGFKPGGKNILFKKSDLDSISQLQNQNRSWFSKLIGKNKKHTDAPTVPNI